MKKQIIKYYVIYLITTILIGCDSDSDPGGRFFWTLIGFPLLGVAYFVGTLVLSIFQSKEENSKQGAPPLPAIIIGAIILFIIYGVYKAMNE